MSKYRKVILDSSAVIALMDSESGASVVQDVLNKAVMSSINYSEAVKYLIDKKEYSDSEARQIMESLIQEVMPFNKLEAEITASLYTDTKHLGLSLGDRACFALSIITGYPIYTADKAWASVNIHDINVYLIR